MDWHELEATYCEFTKITPEQLRLEMEQRFVDLLPEGTTAADIEGCRGWLTTDVMLMRQKAVDLLLIVTELPGWIQQGRPKLRKPKSVPTGNHGATMKQREWLADLGFPLKQTHGWSRAQASREIDRAMSR